MPVGGEPGSPRPPGVLAIDFISIEFLKYRGVAPEVLYS